MVWMGRDNDPDPVKMPANRQDLSVKTGSPTWDKVKLLLQRCDDLEQAVEDLRERMLDMERKNDP